MYIKSVQLHVELYPFRCCVYGRNHEVSHCGFGLCGAHWGSHQVRKQTLYFSKLHETTHLWAKSGLWFQDPLKWKCLCLCCRFLRIPLIKHKSMREALREKGTELPYQDPALKYQPDEFAGSANMYINNYADVRNRYFLKQYTQRFFYQCISWMMGLYFLHFLFPLTDVSTRPPTMEPSALEHPPSLSRCCLTLALPTCGWTPSTVTLRPVVSTNQQASQHKIPHLSLSSERNCT